MSKTNFFPPTCVVNFKFISLFDRVQIAQISSNNPNTLLPLTSQLTRTPSSRQTRDRLGSHPFIAFVIKTKMTKCRWKMNKMKGDKESNAKLFCFSCRSSTERPETDRNMTSAPSSPAATPRRYLHPPQSAAQSTISKSSRRSRRLRSQRPYSPVYSNINYNDVTDRFVQSYQPGPTWFRHQGRVVQSQVKITQGQCEI